MIERPRQALATRFEGKQRHDQRPLVQERRSSTACRSAPSWTPTATASATSGPDAAARLSCRPRRHRDLADAVPDLAESRRRLRRQSDYYSVDPRFGTLGDFVEFTHGAKQRGMRVHHRSRRQPHLGPAPVVPATRATIRIVEVSRLVRLGRRRSPRDAERGRWCFPACRSRPGPSTRSARRWYFHRFYDFQPDLNTANPQVQAEILKIMGFWLQLGVSGFRMDAVPFVIAAKGAEREDSRARSTTCCASFREFLQWRQGDAIILGEANVLPNDRPGVLRRGRRAAADDVQLPGQPAPVLRAGGRRRRPLVKALRGDRAAARDRAVGHVPAQPRRARSRPAAPTTQRQRVFAAFAPENRHAALRSRHPPPPRADARRRPAAPRAGLQPAVHAARHAGHPLRRRDRHGRRPSTARAQLRAHADAVVDRAARRLHHGATSPCCR